MTADCSRACISRTSEMAVARVLGYLNMDLQSAGRAAVKCSVVLYASTFQNCNLRACFALLFLVLARKCLKFLNKMFILDFSPVRHLYHIQLSPMALLVITCLECCGYFWEVFLLVFWGFIFWIIATLAKLFCLYSSYIHSSTGRILFYYFIKSKSLCMTPPVRNLTIYLGFFPVLYSFDGIFLVCALQK